MTRQANLLKNYTRNYRFGASMAISGLIISRISPWIVRVFFAAPTEIENEGPIALHPGAAFDVPRIGDIVGGVLIKLSDFMMIASIVMLVFYLTALGVLSVRLKTELSRAKKAAELAVTSLGYTYLDASNALDTLKLLGSTEAYRKAKKTFRKLTSDWILLLDEANGNIDDISPSLSEDAAELEQDLLNFVDMTKQSASNSKLFEAAMDTA